MLSVGTITQLWQYPVSSIGGERINSLILAPTGVRGDRAYGLIDGTNGKPATPEKDARWRKALFLEASANGKKLPFITFPTGLKFSVDDPDLLPALANYFGFRVLVAAYEHTRRREGLPITALRHPHFHVHLLTTASLQELGRRSDRGVPDSRRFRPTMVIDAGGEGFVEGGWVGRRLRIGNTELRIVEETKRCGITLIPQPGIDEDPEILRNILRYNRRILGIYGQVEVPGPIHCGDKLWLL